MPKRNGTGPRGAGSMTGKGLGLCKVDNAVMHGTAPGRGIGCRHACSCGSGKGFAVNPISSQTQKEMLNERKTLLQDQLKAIDKQLENF